MAEADDVAAVGDQTPLHPEAGARDRLHPLR